ncbi:hypothetical protein NE452_18435, partial [Paeniclostridium sordellii]|nr:hypothetical protein [Paeniclostridium sordellii]
VDFTADMENMLDGVEEGNIYWKDVVADVYTPLKEAIEEAIENIEKINMDEETDEICETCGSNMVIKYFINLYVVKFTIHSYFIFLIFKRCIIYLHQ